MPWPGLSGRAAVLMFSIRSQKPFMGNGLILDDFLGYRHFRKFHEISTRVCNPFLTSSFHRFLPLFWGPREPLIIGPQLFWLVYGDEVAIFGDFPEQFQYVVRGFIYGMDEAALIVQPRPLSRVEDVCGWVLVPLVHILDGLESHRTIGSWVFTLGQG